jgi:hypothetical protein
MNHLEEVRAKVIEAVPEIARKYYDDGTYRFERTVRLSDVLRAMTKDWHREPPLNTFVFFGNQKNDLLCVVSLWNLRADSLDDQSQGCIDFLYSVLCV